MDVVLYLCAAAVVIAGIQVLLELTVPGGRVPPWVAARLIWRRPVPPVAAGLVVLMIAMAIAQTVHPAIIGALERDPDGGWWWRCVTALLVQSSGTPQILFNLAALAAVTPVAARTLGNRWTLTVYLVTGVTSHLVSEAAWQPTGAGDSVAICGLVGALALYYLLRGTRRELRLVLALIPLAGVVLCALTNNHGVGVLAGCVFGVVFSYLPTHGTARLTRRPSAERAAGRTGLRPANQMDGRQ
jgi:rhomboid protease GluP